MTRDMTAEVGRPDTPDGDDPQVTNTERRRIWRLYSSSPDAKRFRRPTDVVLLVVAVLAIIGLAVVAPGPTEFDDTVTELIQDISGPAGWVWKISYALITVWALLLVVVVAFSKGRRRLLGDFALAIFIAIGLAGFASVAAGTSISDGIRALFSPGPPPVYLAMRLAVVTAIVVTASPHLTRPMRNIARAIITIGAIGAIGLGVSFPIGVVAGFFVGIGAAAITHLILGSPGGHPTPARIAEDLAELGLEVSDVRPTSFAVPGVGLFTAASSTSDTRLLVKVFARDAWDDQWLTGTWQSLMRRTETAASNSSRLHRVEHEAVATLIAQRAGVPVLPVIAVGETAEGDALLASEVSGVPLVDVPTDQITDDYLHSCWGALRSLHEAGIAHGQIDKWRLIRADDGTARLADLGASVTAASDLAKRSDDVRLLVVTAILIGHERALAAAQASIGKDGIAALLPYLQPAVLSRPVRKAVSAGQWSLKDLTAAAVEIAGVEPPKLEKLQRVTPKSILLTVLLVVFSYLIVTKIAGADFSAIAEALASANYWWLLAGLLVAPTAQVAFSFGTLGASMVPLRYFPVLMLQYAIQFIAVVLPATAARLALEVRFFQRFGIAPGAALSMGALDSGMGFVVQIGLLLLIGLSSLPGLTEPLGGDSSSTDTSTSSGLSPVLILAVAMVVIGLISMIVVPKFRNRIKSRIPKWRAQTGEQLRAVRETLVVLRKPSKVGLMIGGNFGAQVIQAVVLGLCLAAFGETAHLSQLILINTMVSLFAGLMPVPGGVGVAEAGYIAGLQAIGVPSAIAVSTALTFRLLTFYLPPLWGSFSMRWLRKNSYV
ncbi:MAG: lysylphosphatidylglycerol synthase domain-containing protein [Candidatus Nanopelagicales bacterium]